MGTLRLVVALRCLRGLVPERLLQKLLSHSLVGKALGDGVPKQMRVHPLLDPRIFGYVLDNLLDAAP